MRKHFIFLFSVLAGLAGFFLFSGQVNAYEHGYKRQTGYIYALAREDLAVYEGTSGEDFREYVPAFSGIVVTDSTDSWYKIKYKTKSGKKSGWVTKDDFASDCLTYDGREKQILANGEYHFTYQMDKQKQSSLSSVRLRELSLFQCKIVFLTDNSYTICRTDTGQYLRSDSLVRADDSPNIWGSSAEAGIFKMIRKGDYYGMQDTTTNRYFGLTESGFLGFVNEAEYTWRIVRKGGKVLDKKSMRVFAQFDPEWATEHYGSGENSDPTENNFCTSACGIFATVNAVYTLTGNYVKPYILADYAVEKYFRIEGSGTDSGFFKAAAKKFGYKYGFAYDGSGESIEQMKKKLQKGDTVIGYVPGHYLAIVDYDKKKDKFLLLDSHYLPKRGTSSFGDWVSKSDLETGGLYAQMFFYFKALEE